MCFPVLGAFPTYRGVRISVWQDRTRQRFPGLYLTLTPSSSGGKGGEEGTRGCAETL
jgi:hypothetical protein